MWWINVLAGHKVITVRDDARMTARVKLEKPVSQPP
jgi:hypothetical protein